MDLADYKAFLDDTVRPACVTVLQQHLLGRTPPEEAGSRQLADLEVEAVTLGVIGAIATFPDGLRVSGNATLSAGQRPSNTTAAPGAARELFYDFVIRLFNTGQPSVIEALEYRWTV